ncbi:MAG: histidine phosphatase family protein [Anaerolineae bacterium]|jgi:phosphohistidine phosphatase|nr:histidine phosphatase family protein [Anaerolineae bacterium]MBT7191646.1 histidine phosphatase family protein [Anaerolineae bacterium]MBT7991911.1 histidine phosphatase family protein [Anaerolineae bacterium]
MKRLVLMRHAEAGWDHPDLSDRDRPLTKAGRSDATRMGALLEKEGIDIDAIFCSSAERTRETLSLFLYEYSFKVEPRYLDLLYHAEIRDYVDMLMQLSPAIESVMLLGHNPTMSGAVEFFTERYVSFSAAAIAYLEFDIEQWCELIEKPEGKLLGFWMPKKNK